MNTNMNHANEYNRLLETAKKRAAELRGDAVNDFWDGAGDVARRVVVRLVRLVRVATRFAMSLTRHQRAERSVEA